LIAARITPDARHTLLENRLSIRTTDGQLERRYLDADEIERALADFFHLAPAPEWRPIIERAARAAS
jgi:N-hydroxyarylamine O-acetyltransferase